MRYTVDVENGFEINLNPSNEIEEIIQNVCVIINTVLGSCPFAREIGCAGEYADKPLTVVENIIASEVYEAVELGEPRASVVNIDFSEKNNDEGRIVPIVEVEINDE